MVTWKSLLVRVALLFSSEPTLFSFLTSFLKLSNCSACLSAWKGVSACA